MKPILGLLLVFALAMPLHATPQEGDQLLVKDGTTRFVHNFRLSRSAEKKLNAWRAKSGNTGNTSTANLDGFYAGLKIKDDKLFLTKVEVDAPPGPKGLDKAEAPLSELFDKKGPVAADWFTGDLWEFFGEIESYTHFRSDMRIYVFKNGRLTGTKEQKSSELK